MRVFQFGVEAADDCYSRSTVEQCTVTEGGAPRGHDPDPRRGVAARPRNELRGGRGGQPLDEHDAGLVFAARSLRLPLTAANRPKCPRAAKPRAPQVTALSTARADRGQPPQVSQADQAMHSTGDLALDVSIVLPCFNEEQHVRAEVDRICAALDASGLSYELLAYDDGSTDGTAAELQDAVATHPALRVTVFRRNGGAGTTRRIGTEQARGRIVAWTDADLTYPNERIPELVRILDDD